MNSSQSKNFKEELLGNDDRPILQNSIISPKNLFRIHYDTIGKNSVSNSDFNNNRIPDYIDSVAFYFDYVYNLEVNIMGFIPPITDSLRGGDNLYDVYVIELVDFSSTNSVYGWTRGEEDFFLNDSLVKCNSFIAIDNNYSPNDSITYPNGNKGPAYKTTGIDGLKITSAHEFNHAIQYSYWRPIEGVDELMEMTSVWIENYINPDINDYFQYLPSLFQKINEFPISDINNAENGYRWSIFFHYLTKLYGTEIVKNIWENLETRKEVFASINQSLKKYNKSLSTTWCEFVPWLYYTSNRAIDTVYYNKASIYPKFQMIYADALLNKDLTISENILPFQILPYRIRNQSGVSNDIQLIDFLLTSSFDELKEENSSITAFQLNISPTDKFENKIEFSNSITYQINGSNTGGQFCSGIYINDGLNYTTESYVFPNPVKISQENVNIILPLDKPGNEYEVNIYDSKMNNIYFGKLKTDRYNGKNCIILNNRDKFTDGIYFYNVVFKEQTFFGKFAIIKN